MTSRSPLFKKVKLVDEQEIHGLIEKKLRQYHPALKAMADLSMDMNHTLNRSDLSPEEKIALLIANQQRFSQIQQGSTQPVPPPLSHPPIPTGSRRLATRQSRAPRVTPAPPPLASPIDLLPSSSSTGTVTTEGSFDDPLSGPEDLRSPSHQGSLKAEEFETKVKAAMENPELKTAVGTSQTRRLPTQSYHMMPSVEDKHKNRLFNFSKMIDKVPHMISYQPDSGEIILEGKLIPNSSFHDLIRDFYAPSGHHNITGQEKLLNTIQNLMSIGQPWANTTLRDVIPRTSFHPSLKPPPPNPKTFKSSRKRSSQKQGGRGLSFPVQPPGKLVRVLHLYS